MRRIGSAAPHSNWSPTVKAVRYSPPIDSLREGRVMSLKTRFGNLRNVLDENNSNPELLSLGCAGGLRELTTGLVRYGARDYDATVGRWTAKDPAGFYAGMANLYVHCANNPANSVDPSGCARIVVDRSGGRLRVETGGGRTIAEIPAGNRMGRFVQAPDRLKDPPPDQPAQQQHGQQQEEEHEHEIAPRRGGHGPASPGFR